MRIDYTPIYIFAASLTLSLPTRAYSQSSAEVTASFVAENQVDDSLLLKLEFDRELSAEEVDAVEATLPRFLDPALIPTASGVPLPIEIVRDGVELGFYFDFAESPEARAELALAEFEGCFGTWMTSLGDEDGDEELLAQRLFIKPELDLEDREFAESIRDELIDFINAQYPDCVDGPPIEEVAWGPLTLEYAMAELRRNITQTIFQGRLPFTTGEQYNIIFYPVYDALEYLVASPKTIFYPQTLVWVENVLASGLLEDTDWPVEAGVEALLAGSSEVKSLAVYRFVNTVTSSPDTCNTASLSTETLREALALGDHVYEVCAEMGLEQCEPGDIDGSYLWLTLTSQLGDPGKFVVTVGDQR